jgi:hypothetical protein
MVCIFGGAGGRLESSEPARADALPNTIHTTLATFSHGLLAFDM